jgi:hypothetical protein
MINRRDFLILFGFLILGGSLMSRDSKELCLTSDIFPPGTFEKIEIKIDRFRSFLIDPLTMKDGKQRLFYDISELPHGRHEVCLRGVKNQKFGPMAKFEFRI